MGKEKSVKRSMRQHRFFSEEFKIQKVKEIEQNQIGISELSRLYNVSRSAIYKWVFQYSLHLKKGVKQVIEMESESRKTKKLQERLAELERAIGQKQLTIDYLEKVIEFSSEELGEDIKKKFDTGSSDGLMMKKGASL
jgi:transposase-like protein